MLLFLCSGSIIHALDDEQDYDEWVVYSHIFHYSYCYVYRDLALTGWPMLLDSIQRFALETALLQILWNLYLLSGDRGAFLTQFILQVNLLVYFAEPAFQGPNLEKSRKLIVFISFLSTLSIFAICIGWFLDLFLMGLQLNFLASFIASLSSCP
jgi:NADH:ubiquinone oxidoreductase subunit 5 (subunit L)/multisubunit Na+/H+ antiporter MnhA subunit